MYNLTFPRTRRRRKKQSMVSAEACMTSSTKHHNGTASTLAHVHDAWLHTPQLNQSKICQHERTHAGALKIDHNQQQCDLGLDPDLEPSSICVIIPMLPAIHPPSPLAPAAPSCSGRAATTARTPSTCTRITTNSAFTAIDRTCHRAKLKIKLSVRDQTGRHNNQQRELGALVWTRERNKMWASR